MAATDVPQYEAWENNGKANVVVKKRGEYGAEIEERVTGGKLLQITRADRHMNQEAAASPELDPFENGMLAPVRLIDPADTASLAEKPNLMSETRMHEVVHADAADFAKVLSGITNEVVVSRLLEVAREENVSVSRVEAIQSHYEDVQPILTNKHTTHVKEERKMSVTHT